MSPDLRALCRGVDNGTGCQQQHEHFFRTKVHWDNERLDYTRKPRNWRIILQKAHHTRSFSNRLGREAASEMRVAASSMVPSPLIAEAENQTSSRVKCKSAQWLRRYSLHAIYEQKVRDMFRLEQINKIKKLDMLNFNSLEGVCKVIFGDPLTNREWTSSDRIITRSHMESRQWRQNLGPRQSISSMQNHKKPAWN